MSFGLSYVTCCHQYNTTFNCRCSTMAWSGIGPAWHLDWPSDGVLLFAHHSWLETCDGRSSIWMLINLCLPRFYKTSYAERGKWIIKTLRPIHVVHLFACFLMQVCQLRIRQPTWSMSFTNKPLAWLPRKPLWSFCTVLSLFWGDLPSHCVLQVKYFSKCAFFGCANSLRFAWEHVCLCMWLIWNRYRCAH